MEYGISSKKHEGQSGVGADLRVREVSRVAGDAGMDFYLGAVCAAVQ